MSRLVYVSNRYLTFYFLIKISITISGESSKKFEVVENDKIIYHLTRFLLLISNIANLLHKSSVLMMKYEQNPSYFVWNLAKMIFLSDEKEFLEKLFVTLELRI
jgi:hypothetical protein